MNRAPGPKNKLNLKLPPGAVDPACDPPSLENSE